VSVIGSLFPAGLPGPEHWEPPRARSVLDHTWGRPEQAAGRTDLVDLAACTTSCHSAGIRSESPIRVSGTEKR